MKNIQLRSQIQDMYIVLASLGVLALGLFVKLPEAKKKLGVRLIASADADEAREAALAQRTAELSQRHRVA